MGNHRFILVEHKISLQWHGFADLLSLAPNGVVGPAPGGQAIPRALPGPGQFPTIGKPPVAIALGRRDALQNRNEMACLFGGDAKTTN